MGLRHRNKYKDEDLNEVTNGWGKTFKYKYNDLHNLVRIDFPDNTYEVIAYNDDQGLGDSALEIARAVSKLTTTAKTKRTHSIITGPRLRRSATEN